MTRTAPPRQYLENLADLVAEARNASRRHVNRGPTRGANQQGEMPCNVCWQYFPSDMFPKRSSKCRACHAQRFREYHRTLRGSATVLLSGARARSKKKGFSCSIRRDDILDMLLHQEGRCAYSGVPMEIVYPNSDWRMSLERINNCLGYSCDNCVLVASEFNSSDHTRRQGVKQEEVHGSAQWSGEKVRLLPSLQESFVDVTFLNRDVANALDIRAFRSEMPLDCPHRRTLRGKSKCLVNHARWHAKQKRLACSIDYTDILQMLLQQGGRCFYSGVPLRYKHCHMDWIISLERLDNTIGYTSGNYVLIAAEFNTPDRTRYAVGDVLGSSQWSLAKVMHVWGKAGYLNT